MRLSFHKLKQHCMRYLWESDPGHLHLRQGTRTLLAAGITLLLLSAVSLETRIMACFAAGLVCQGINGAKIREQKITFCIAANLLLGYFLLINHAATSHLAIAIIFTAASFLVFAARSISTRYALFPLFTWTMGFVTNLFPGVAGLLLLERFLCIVCGCMIAFIVYFYLLPPRQLSYFFRNMRYFIALINVTILKLQQHVTKFTTDNKLSQKMQRYATKTLRRSLRKYYLHNQNILSSLQIIERDQEDQLLHILTDHYLAGKALLRLQESLLALLNTDLLTSLCLQQDLLRVLTSLRLFTKTLVVDLQNFSIKLTTEASYPQSFIILTNKLESALEPPLQLVTLYHFVISLNELYHNLVALTQHACLQPEVTHAP